MAELGEMGVKLAAQLGELHPVVGLEEGLEDVALMLGKPRACARGGGLLKLVIRGREAQEGV